MNQRYDPEQINPSTSKCNWGPLTTKQKEEWDAENCKPVEPHNTSFEEIARDFVKETDYSVGVKYDKGKPMMGLLPPKAIKEVAHVLTFGANKYSPNNWKKIEDLQSRYADAAFRHIFDHLEGEELDPESNLNHLAHAICCLLFKLEDHLEKKDELAHPKVPSNKSMESTKNV